MSAGPFQLPFSFGGLELDFFQMPPRKGRLGRGGRNPGAAALHLAGPRLPRLPELSFPLRAPSLGGSPPRPSAGAGASRASGQAGVQGWAVVSLMSRPGPGNQGPGSFRRKGHRPSEGLQAGGWAEGTHSGGAKTAAGRRQAGGAAHSSGAAPGQGSRAHLLEVQRESTWSLAAPAR